VSYAQPMRVLRKPMRVLRTANACLTHSQCVSYAQAMRVLRTANACLTHSQCWR